MNATNNKNNIYGRIYSFVLLLLSIIKYIPKTYENVAIIKQVVRSAGSVGANATEADGAESKKEFIYRFTIAKKEAKETFYWLSLLNDHNPSIKDKLQVSLTENQELIAIISKIIINTKQNMKINGKKHMATDKC